MSSSSGRGERLIAKDHSHITEESTDVIIQDALVSRLHTEITQLIFELVVFISSPSDRIKAAILLSGICRRWREIAIATPTLWATLDVTAQQDILSGESPLVKMAISRIKDASATISIDEIDLSHLIQCDPQDWAFFKLANLSELNLRFQRDAATEYFTEPSFITLQYLPLRRLSVYPSPWTRTRAHLDLRAVYLLFPNLTHLTLDAMLIDEGDIPLSTSLVHCELQRSSVNLHTIHTAFPNLENLHLVQSRLRGSSTLPSSRESPAMRHLVMRGTDFFQDPDIALASYPNLTSLYSTGVSSEHLIEFLRRHPSMKHIDCFLTDLHVIECAKVASQLAHICLTVSIDPFVHWEKYGLATPPFPHLKTLLLGNRMDPFTDVEFEALVKARFLPVGHPQSLLEDSSLHVEELRLIRKELVDWEAEDWANHPLCSEAKIMVVPYEEEVDSNHIVLRWM